MSNPIVASMENRLTTTITRLESLLTLNKRISELGHSNLEATRKGDTYYLLHICRNENPVPLFHSKNPSEVKDFLEARYA